MRVFYEVHSLVGWARVWKLAPLSSELKKEKVWIYLKNKDKTHF